MIRDTILQDFYDIDMRDHEKSMDLDYIDILYLSDISKTVVENGEILTIYGMFANDGMWQIPSNLIRDNMFRYVRNCLKPIKELIKGRDAFSICLDDELHNRWMRFIGFERTDKECDEGLAYYVKQGGVLSE